MDHLGGTPLLSDDGSTPIQTATALVHQIHTPSQTQCKSDNLTQTVGVYEHQKDYGAHTHSTNRSGHNQTIVLHTY